MVKGHVFTLVMAGVAAAPALAQEFYLGGGLAYSSGESSVAVGGPSALETAMVSLLVGQRFDRATGFWGWEASADLSFGAEATFFDGTGTCADNGSDGRPFLCRHDATLRFVGVLGTEVTEGTSVFGTLGLGILQGDFSTGAFDSASGYAYGPTVGLGLSHSIGPGTALRGEVIYDSFTNSDQPGSGSSDYTGPSVRLAVTRSF